MTSSRTTVPELQRRTNTLYPRTASEEELIDLLAEPPPAIERVDRFESWQLDSEGNKIKRVCGSRRSLGVPEFVPDGMPNPHGVTNPFEQYRCLQAAGAGTSHKGIGRCWLHNRGEKPTMAQMTRPTEDIPPPTDKEFPEDDKKLILELGDFDFYLGEAKAQTTPDELLDMVRPLYELEALKLMAIDWMRKFGYKPAAIEAIATRIKDGAEIQLTLAKRDHEIIRNKAIATMMRVFVTGVLGILGEELKENPKAARTIAERLNAEVLLPTHKIGISEMMKRQDADGALNRSMMVAIADAEFEDGEVEGETP